MTEIKYLLALFICFMILFQGYANVNVNQFAHNSNIQSYNGNKMSSVEKLCKIRGGMQVCIYALVVIL